MLDLQAKVKKMNGAMVSERQYAGGRGG